MRDKLAKIILVAAIALATAPSAGASQFLLNIDGCTGGCGPAPFGAVTLTQDVNRVLVTLDLFNGSLFMGANEQSGSATFAFNLKTDSAIVISFLEPTEPASGWEKIETASAIHMSDFGYFDFGVRWTKNGSGKAYPPPVKFYVARTGLQESDFEAASTGGNNQEYFAADIATVNPTGGFGATGKVGGSCEVGTACAPQVPEPATMLLLGSGLMGAGFFARKRRK